MLNKCLKKMNLEGHEITFFIYIAHKSVQCYFDHAQE